MTAHRLDIHRAAGELGRCPNGLIVAVLGYSSRRATDLHPVCEARLVRAATETEGAHAVVLSGWARRRDRPPEAELMGRAWPGPPVPLVFDPHARTTAETAALTSALIRDLGAGEVRIVTSSWHMRRATYLFRRMLRGSGVHVSSAAADDRATAARRLRELAGWAVAPVQVRQPLRATLPTPVQEPDVGATDRR